jgi:transposase
MMMLPAGVKVHIAAGVTDMRKGMDGLAMLVEAVLRADPFSGHLFAFRGRKANLIKIVFWDGNGLCLFTKRLDQGGFIWPQTDDHGGRVVLSSGLIDHSQRHCQRSSAQSQLSLINMVRAA